MKEEELDTHSKTLPMFVNEDQLFRPGPQSDGTWTYLKNLRDAGIKIDGIGNQAATHFYVSMRKPASTVTLSLP